MTSVGVNIKRSMQMMAVMNPDWTPQGSLFLIAPDASPEETDNTVGFGSLILKSAEEFPSASDMNSWLMFAYNQCDEHEASQQELGFPGGMMIFLRYAIWAKEGGDSGTLLYFMLSTKKSIAGQMKVERSDRGASSVVAGYPVPVDSKYMIFSPVWGEPEFGDSF